MDYRSILELHGPRNFVQRSPRLGFVTSIAFTLLVSIAAGVELGHRLEAVTLIPRSLVGLGEIPSIRMNGGSASVNNGTHSCGEGVQRIFPPALIHFASCEVIWLGRR